MPEKNPSLIVFGGLPRTVKTTLARAVAEEHASTDLRIDMVEQALRSSGVPVGGDVGPACYLAAHKVAETNLLIGRMVATDLKIVIPGLMPSQPRAVLTKSHLSNIRAKQPAFSLKK